MISYFAREAQEYLESLETDLREWTRMRPILIPSTSCSARQTSLKGSAYTVGFQSIGDLTHHIEDFMGLFMRGTPEFRPGHTGCVAPCDRCGIRSLMWRDLVRSPAPDNGLSRRCRNRRNSCKQRDSHAGVRTGQSLRRWPRPDPESDGVESAKSRGDRRRAEVTPASTATAWERLPNLVGELVIDRGRSNNACAR